MCTQKKPHPAPSLNPHGGNNSSQNPLPCIHPVSGLDGIRITDEKSSHIRWSINRSCEGAGEVASLTHLQIMHLWQDARHKTQDAKPVHLRGEYLWAWQHTNAYKVRWRRGSQYQVDPDSDQSQSLAYLASLRIGKEQQSVGLEQVSSDVRRAGPSHARIDWPSHPRLLLLTLG